MHIYRGTSLGKPVIDQQVKPRSLHALSEATIHCNCIALHVSCDALGDSTVNNGYRSPHVLVGSKSKNRLYQGQEGCML